MAIASDRPFLCLNLSFVFLNFLIQSYIHRKAIRYSWTCTKVYGLFRSKLSKSQSWNIPHGIHLLQEPSHLFHHLRWTVGHLLMTIVPAQNKNVQVCFLPEQIVIQTRAVNFDMLFTNITIKRFFLRWRKLKRFPFPVLTVKMIHWNCPPIPLIWTMEVMCGCWF